MTEHKQTMRYRRFGRTELEISVFSCGGMRYQQSWNDMPASQLEEDKQANLEATIQRGLDLGINHIETARGYGSSEMQLGLLLPKLPRSSFYIQTKVTPEPKDPAAFEAKLKTSLENLQLETIDFLGIHGINNQELLEATLAKGGALEVARSYQKQGRIRFIGFSTHGPLDVIVAANNTGEFDYVNLHWYFVNQFNWPAIEAARRHDMGVFIISPTDKGGMLQSPSPRMAELCAPLSPMQFNDLFCLSHPEVHTLSVGASCPQDFDAHVEALEHYDNPGSLIDPIADRIDQAMEKALGRDWWRGWWKGIPSWEKLPGQMNLFYAIRLWNWAKGLGMIEFAQSRYNMLGNASHWVAGQNLAALPQHDLLPYLQDSPFAARLIAEAREAHEALFNPDAPAG